MIMNIIDMHCDTLSQICWREKEGRETSLRDGEGLRVTLEKMKKGDYLLQNFAAFVAYGEAEDPFASAMELADVFDREMERNSDLIRPVRSWEEIMENKAAGRMSGMLTLEEGAVCMGELENLQKFYDRGVRMMTFGWNYPNELSYPAVPEPGQENGIHTGKHEIVWPGGKYRSQGLTERGFLFLEEMERLGMIVDVSHLSDDGFLDVWEHTGKPFVASHSNARSLCPHGRNLTDRMLHMLGERGGVAGLNYYSEFVTGTGEADRNHADRGPESSVYDVARHAIHMMDQGGKGCVGLGSDFDGFEGASQPEDASRTEDLAWALHRLGVKEDTIDGILGENVLRVYRELL